MMVRIFLLFFLANVSIVFSQEQNTFLFSGEIESLDSSISVEFTNVINFTNKKSTISDRFGRFEIEVSPKDKIVISSVSFRKKLIVISDKHNAKNRYKIWVEPSSTILKEVVFKPRLSGDLKSDLKLIATKKFELPFAPSPGKKWYKGSMDEKIEKAVPSIPVSFNIEAIYKSWSGYYKKLKKLRENKKNSSTLKRIIAFYRVPFFLEMNIPKDEIYGFLYSCQGKIVEGFERGKFIEVSKIILNECEKSEKYSTKNNQKK